MSTKFLLTIGLLGFLISACSQKTEKKKEYEVVCVGFYNLENLFDTIIDPDTNKILQDDFTVHGPKQWNAKKYNAKLANMATVISKLGIESTPDGPAVLGVCEIENRSVLEDLVKTDPIKKRDYQIVHYDSPDRRGIDVGFLYQEKYFKVTRSKSFTLKLEGQPNFATRDQLLVSGELLGEKTHFIVAHWPSRRGGEKKSNYKREAAAALAKTIIDSLKKNDPLAKVILMGDLNDDPKSPSVKTVLNASGKVSKLTEEHLFNPMEPLYNKGIGTLAWRDTWNLFDQFILTQSWLDSKAKYDDLTYYNAVVYNKSYLTNAEGSYAGYPFRTYVGTTHIGGYSDHFPVYLLLIRSKK